MAEISPTKTVAELLDALFKTQLRADGREYTYQEVTDGTGGQLDPTYIARVRKGKIPNPGRNTLVMLCKFFGVEPAYFFPELNPPSSDEPESLDQKQRRRVSEAIAREAAELPPDAQSHLLALIAAIKSNRNDT